MEVMAIGRISQTVQRVAELVCSTEIVHVITLCQCTEAKIVLHLGMPRNQDLVRKSVVQVTIFLFLNVRSCNIIILLE